MLKKIIFLAFVAFAVTLNAQTSDMKMLAVKGPVKRIVYTEGSDPVLNVDLVLFNRNGLIVKMVPDSKYYPNEIAVINRFSNNWMKEWNYKWYANSFDQRMRIYTFSYDYDGYVNDIKSGFFEMLFDTEVVWDETGKIKLLDCNGSYLLEIIHERTTYRYLNTDRYGNWLEAEYYKTETEYDETNPDDVSMSTSSGRISRIIEYYE